MITHQELFYFILQNKALINMINIDNYLDKNEVSQNKKYRQFILNSFYYLLVSNDVIAIVVVCSRWKRKTLFSNKRSLVIMLQ